MNHRILKKMIINLLIVFICVILIVFFIIKDKIKEKKDNSVDSNIIISEPEKKDQWEEDKEQLEREKEYYLLKKCDDTFSYFLIKQCVENFYNQAYSKNALDIIDKEAISKLEINEKNVSYLYNNFDDYEFCIDEIYKQKIDISKDIYVVYNRLKRNSKNNLPIEKNKLFVKIDRKNVTFSVYPYEYLKKFDYLDLTEDDKIKIENYNEILENSNNQYKTSLISKKDQVCVKELFDRYKFDVKFDISGLYDKINIEYKLKKFPSREDFKNSFTQENISDSEIKEYKVTSKRDMTQYVIVCDNNTYIFESNSLMDYTIQLDSYTILDNSQKSFFYFPNSQAKYCINRIIKAINNKDYDFVYSHLDIIQKNNNFKNIEDLKNYLNKVFYDKTAFEINDNYYQIADNIYQFDVKITDETKKEFSYKKLKIIVTLKKDGEFLIGISN